MINTLTKLIGKGMNFPFEPNSRGGVAKSEYLDRINQSLFILFNTPKGSRLMMPEFGSNLYQYRFDPFDNILLERMRETITEDIRRWEPRIIINSIKFLDSPESRDQQILYISIDYHIINTDVEGNFVYPYRKEVYDIHDSI